MSDSENTNRFKKGTNSLLETDSSGGSPPLVSQTPLNNSINDFLSDIFPDEPKQPKGKNMNLYLSMEVINALKNYSAEKNVSMSKVVDTILRRMLING